MDSIPKGPTVKTDLQITQYLQTDDLSVPPAELVREYERGAQDLRLAVAGMTVDQARARPIEGRWSTIEVVAHLSGVELYYTERIERTIALEHPLLLSVDERPYPSRLDYQSLDLLEELDLFSSLRQHESRVLSALPEDSWQRTAVHSQTGVVTLRQLVFHAARHLRHHLPFIAEKRATLSKQA
jgi:uncharacterized damage-inducible protein DinB